VVRDAGDVEGRVLRVDRDALLVDWGAQLGKVRHAWSEAGARFLRLPRRSSTGPDPRRRLVR
jgi:hypothetical protein